MITTEDGLKAVEIFRARYDEIDCVLLDLTMPHMDGEEAFREIRRIRSDIRIIMSSGYSEQDISQCFAEKGMTGFIHKPYVMKELQKVIREAFEGTLQ